VIGKYSQLPGGGVISVSSWAPMDSNVGAMEKAKPAFLQAVVRHVGEIALVKSKKGAGSLEGGVESRGTPPPGVALGPLWECVVHEASGLPYWWDKVSNAVSWRAPVASTYKASDPLFPFRIESTGLWVPVSPHTGGGEVTSYHFTHDVVWERSVLPGSIDKWVVVRL